MTAMTFLWAQILIQQQRGAMNKNELHDKIISNFEQTTGRQLNDREKQRAKEMLERVKGLKPQTGGAALPGNDAKPNTSEPKQ